ncbi:exported hypothetical protein [Cupriavidus oxalaticus]|uniref:Uncharacterized protein n=1 Tax=Cupriavidus oxalaticus TaxID=96344 RepID=A0A375G3J6_9BURK|nr:exported hypothetical protein [Cupriavidus oxalaticus]
MRRCEWLNLAAKYVGMAFSIVLICAVPAIAWADNQFLDSAVVVDASPAPSYDWNGSPYSAPQPAKRGKCRHQVIYVGRLFDVDLPACLKVGATVRVAVQVDLVYPDDGIDVR